MRLYHPALGRHHDFPSVRSADLARRSGWVDPPTEDDVQHKAPEHGGLSHGGDDVPAVPYTEDED